MFSSNSSQVSSAAVFVEDVFSTYLYTGTGASQTITNGIDLSTKGGLVWIKDRSNAESHSLWDTARGVSAGLQSNATSAQYSDAISLTAYNSNGFSLGADTNVGWVNRSPDNYVSWTFREQPKFFDVVTYTGDGISGRTVAHNLGSVPGCIIVKRTDTTAAWAVYHRSLANTQYLVLNTTAAAATGATWWNSTTPTSAVFSVGTDASVNASGGTYVAYVFAHDAGGFGLAGTDNVISCGTFTTDGGGLATVSLGYEPQWVLVRSSQFADNWVLIDSMRGFSMTADARLIPNSSVAEATITDYRPTSTGFEAVANLYNSATYIYIAIRRGPMKVPTLGTSVFALGGTASSTLTTSFAVDAFIQNSLTSNVANSRFCSRLQGSDLRLVTSSTDAEAADNGDSQFNGASYTVVGAGSGIVFGFGRAPGFFDEVCYTGTGSATTVTHNLTVVPQIMIVRRRESPGAWRVYVESLGSTQFLGLDSSNAADTSSAVWNATAPTSSVFSVATNGNTNASGGTYVNYLFATCPGVSKVGSYTGTGTTLQVDCGFTGGARFVLIKRTDSTGDWFVWNSALGIIAGNDPYIRLNSTAAQVTNTDYVDTYNAGFEISSTAPAAINASAGTFVFLAIA